MAQATCSIGDCDKPRKTRGLCIAHYTNLIRHGEPSPRKRGEVRDGKKICSRCLRDQPLAVFGCTDGRPRPACHECEKSAARAQRDADPEAARRYSLTWQKRHPDRVRDRQARRRAAKKGAPELGRVERLGIFERDGWVCQLCNLPIVRDVAWPHPASPSLDHIVPLSLGGPHTPQNCQASHLICNMRKGAGREAV